MLQHLFSKDEGLAKLTEQVLNQILQAQTSKQLRAEPYERTDERQGYRNGHRERSLTTRIGKLVLEVPRLRSGKFSTEIFERCQRSEQALLISLMEMVINGVSTRKVKNVVVFSKSSVSELCKKLDQTVKAWNERDLSEKKYPFILADALVIRVRKCGRVVP